jgi:hypothetical protein
MACESGHNKAIKLEESERVEHGELLQMQVLLYLLLPTLGESRAILQNVDNSVFSEQSQCKFQECRLLP